MFNALSVPFGCVMLYNVVKLKDGVAVEDVELVVGEIRIEEGSVNASAAVAKAAFYAEFV